jgi:hypothetical protein
VMASPQGPLASAQGVMPITDIPPCGTCDAKHPRLGRIFRR